MPERVCLSIFSIASRNLIRAPCASWPISFSSCLALIPIWRNASWNFLPCLPAVCSLLSIALMAVPAFSGALPRLIKEPARALACTGVKPNCRAVPPIRLSAGTISFAFAAVLSDKWLIASPSLLISVIGI